MNKITKEWANKIYDILADSCEASDNPRARSSFVYAQGNGCLEYRFCGVFGFGEKFWDNNGRWYVDYYQEHHTEERAEAQRAANKELAALHQEWLQEGPLTRIFRRKIKSVTGRRSGSFWRFYFLMSRVLSVAALSREVP